MSANRNVRRMRDGDKEYKASRGGILSALQRFHTETFFLYIIRLNFYRNFKLIFGFPTFLMPLYLTISFIIKWRHSFIASFSLQNQKYSKSLMRIMKTSNCEWNKNFPVTK